MESPKPVPLTADLDLRLVRYFTVVAEHRHFGRAAADLLIAQPSLSRQIARLERQLGVRLFDRTPQGTALTAAGEVFAPRARALLRAAAQAAAATRAAAQPSRITIGHTPGIIATPAVRLLRRQHPDADVQMLFLDWNEPRAALLDHRVDAVVTRLPLETDGLLVTILYDEPRLLMVPIDHRLAGKESVTLDDIADEPIPRMPDPVWNAYWRIDPRPDGSPAPDGPLVEAIEDKNELIAAGQAVAIVPAGIHGVGRIRPDLTTIPLYGIEPSHVVLATRAADRGRLVAAFRRAAAECLTGPPGDECHRPRDLPRDNILRMTTPQHRADLFIDPADDPREGGPRLGGERATLTEFLRGQRLTLELKCADLDAAELATRSVEPSTMSLLGLIRHMAEVERSWFRRRFAGNEDLPKRYQTAEDPDGDFNGAVADPEVVKEAWAAWREEMAFANEFIADHDFDFVGSDSQGEPVSLRELLVHMIEEYARHNGHADLLRERIDGRVGQ